MPSNRKATIILLLIPIIEFLNYEFTGAAQEVQLLYQNTFIVPHYALVSSFTSKTQRYNPPQKIKGDSGTKQNFQIKSYDLESRKWLRGKNEKNLTLLKSK